MDKNNLLKNVLEEQLASCKLGIIIKYVRNIDPLQVLSSITNADHLYASIVGYDGVSASETDTYTVSVKIEDAVLWRSDPNKSGKILVFINDEVVKLHSLAEFDVLSNRDLMTYLIDFYSKKTTISEPVKKLLEYFRKNASHFNYEDIDKFLSQSDKNWSICGDNLWVLHRLCDHEILSKKDKIGERLDDNRDIIDILGILQDSDRQSIYRTLSRYKDDEDIRDTFFKLSKYIDSIDKKDLEGLEYDKVKILLAGKRKKDEITDQRKTPTKPGDDGGDVIPTVTHKKVVKMREFEKKVAEVVVNQDEERISLLSDLYEDIKDCLANRDNPIIIANGGELFDNRQLKLDISREDFRTNICMMCSCDTWGGIIETKEPILRVALYSSYDNFPKGFNPHDKDGLLSINNSSIYEIIQRFDNLLLSDSRYKELLPSFEKMEESRKELIGILDSIMFFPIIAFGIVEDNYKVLKEYISTWAELLRRICDNEPLMREKSINWAPALIKCILSLDILYIQTPTEWKSLLLPTHPLHLWKYYEIFKNLKEERASFKDKDFEELIGVLNSLPQTLNFVIIDKFICNHDNIELPYSGNVEMLPAYENKTNRYLGTDGVESINETILRWLQFAPFTKYELRIAITDTPDISQTVKDLSHLIETDVCKKINVTFFYTRSKKEGNDFIIFDYADSDENTLKFISEGSLQISSHNVENNKSEINSYLQKYPVHVAFFFDQLEYSIGHTPNKKCLYISPLVVTYDYNFDEVSNKGEIYPSSDMDSGMIGDYQTLLVRSGMITSTDIPHPTLAPNNNVSHAISTIADNQAQWLVIADRSISQYQPNHAFPIGEKVYGRRTVAIWASEESRVISNYVKLLKQYNLYPDQEHLVEILSEFGHISSEGLVTIPKIGASKNDSEKKQKGLLGTVFTAYWYSQHNPGSLIASLDDTDARLWLSKLETSNERADLIGLKYIEEEDKLIIQPIEVKTWSEAEPVKITYDSTTKEYHIEGHAADQVAMTTKLVSAIFNNEDTSLNIFSAARREALKYHIVSECFRVSHDCEWQKKWNRILKRAFSDEKMINIEVSGIVMYVDLQSSASDYKKDCINTNMDDTRMDYIKLGTDRIQKVILNTAYTSQSDPDNIVFDIDTQSYLYTESTLQEEKDNDDSMTVSNEPVLTYSSLSETSNPLSEDADEMLSTSDNSQPSGEELDHIRKMISDFKKSCSVYNINLDYCDEAENAVIGPNLVRVQFSLKRGQSLSPLLSKIEDISREMEMTGVTIQQITNSKKLNLDIPRIKRETVLFSSVVGKLPQVTSPEQLFFTLGRTPNGEDLCRNLAEMPHMLVAGSTGSGKTVFLFTLLASLLKTHKSPDELKILLSSSGLEDFILFNNLPHLIGGRVIDDAAEAVRIITTTVIEEFDKRAEILTKAQVPNIIEYNKIAEKKLYPIVVVIDEFADLSDQFTTKQERESFFNPVKRIAQIGRKRGIHLVLCTQRPSATLVPSNIKSQITGRIALRVNDSNSSRMILEDSGNARFLLNHGDMIYKNAAEMERAQGYYISTDDLRELINEIMSYNSKNQ